MTYDTLNSLQHDLLFDIEINFRSRLDIIVGELMTGRTDLLKKISYNICVDLSSIKVYEVESYLINEELSSLNENELSLLWLATDNGVNYDPDYDDRLYEFKYEVHDVFNYVYNNIELYNDYDYSREDFLQLLENFDYE